MVYPILSTTGSYTYQLSLANVGKFALMMCQVMPTAITSEHLNAVQIAANLMQSTWSADGINLWEMSLTTVPLVQGQAQYSIPGTVVTITDVYYTVGSGATATDRIMTPVSRTEYANYSQKQQQGAPTTYWFNQQIASPVINLWEVPDGTQASFSYYSLAYLQTAALGSSALPDVPRYFLEAYTLGLAARLAIIYAPDRAAALQSAANAAYGVASRRNIEPSSLFISPMLNSYWRT
jgi:hypothetical protein